MGDFYRQVKTRKLIALLIRSGFYSSGGTKHGKYVHPDKPGAVVVPRHRTLSPGVTKQVCEVLCDYYKIPESEIKKIF